MTAGIEWQYEVVEGIELDKLKPLPKHVLVRWLSKPETRGGVLIPQNRQRAGFMKGQILGVGPDCDPAIEAGKLVEFNGLGDKCFLGVQDPADRDTVFFTRYENIYGIVNYHAGDKHTLDMVGAWVLVTPDEIPGERKSGLALPDHVRKAQLRRSRGLTGTVDSAGGKQDSCKAGDHIVFDAMHATEIHIGDHSDPVKLLIDGNEDVIGFVENGEDENGNR